MLRCTVWSSLTLWVLTWGAAPDSEGMLWPPILLIEAPALGDLVGTCLSPVLGSWRLCFPFGNGSLGRTGEHLVLQAGFPTAESKQWEGGNMDILMAFTALCCVKKCLLSYCFVVWSLICQIQHWCGNKSYLSWNAKWAMSYSGRSHVHIRT